MPSYLRRRTKIPVPAVHGFGNASDPPAPDNPTGLAFLLLDYVPGKILPLTELLESPEDTKVHFYRQLLDIYAELYAQKFDAIGSLMPGPADDEPILGPLQSIQQNDLHIHVNWGRAVSLCIESDADLATPTSFKNTYRRDLARRERERSRAVSAHDVAVPPARIFASAADFVHHQYALIFELFKMPSKVMQPGAAEAEVFALHHLRSIVFSSMRPSENLGPFVLSHPDLRWSNIIVEDSHDCTDAPNASNAPDASCIQGHRTFTIRAILDWEFAGTVPPQLFLPPFWLTGLPAELLGWPSYEYRYRECQRILVSLAASSAHCRDLAQAWTEDLATTLEFAAASVLRHHNEALELHWKLVYKLCRYSIQPDEAKRDFVKMHGQNSPWGRDIEWRMALSQMYRKYLVENNLWTEPEQPEVFGSAAALSTTLPRTSESPNLPSAD
ncbi:hypothetical protein SPBR_05014 [Sporothrix brasiliensis 5110]|uniref:Aminoglycoside phosphotransferase domain-containing protein n=1 Tax=Sporothrix brasiliensis 5110 TaxID=1398154 RepID=A0A0C2F9D8_9PEZI|nr:uncharacterized protein SPBR_05014 [Sporothrix brasiliensis 5110]KIH87663.1 hypothetical protein SPBR_05014 [Sporothrix brasiliensis 5110]